ncbi:glucose-6-phosphate isomerase [Plastoroseomonas hellenica]|uniref:glucose-6-phosphate isomerase n=1 Tax=Plastoroseomonas hellenica TaxID=2687306 RepID=UPI001BACBBCD|nr:glucose-6-phosphate isomerase [Plastoroseomonas hellenica]MBR0643814.1 glucose-6-phosphate isomerase [Plastoroseomonas hellenica]
MSNGIEAAWQAVTDLAADPASRDIRARFAADPARASRWTHRADGLVLDLSRTSLDEASLAALLALAEATGVFARRDAMARGEAINTTEARAVMHMALRAPADAGLRAGAEDASATVHDTLGLMQSFVEALHAGKITGSTGERFTDVLNIGIGGSDLGPAMAARALSGPHDRLRVHFLGNVDAHAWEAIRPNLDPARTLVLIASKTFTTQETMANARLARAWLAGALGEAGLPRHLAALSTNLQATADFGIAPARVFGFRDWVGGRFSMWSAIGLAIALAQGWDRFARLLEGAHAMDAHFLRAPPRENLPLLLALTEAWHVNALKLPTRAVLPYDERLARLPAHLQQVEMESLGKGVTLSGQPVAHATGPVVFGEAGTNAQHSFMQLIHQGPVPVPVDFILVANPDHGHADSHRKLLANGLAQAEALLVGRGADAVATEMRAAGIAEERIAAVLPHRVFTGNRPSVTILLPRLDPFSLGALVALYEHKVFCLGALWGINAFDQWGVELGKQLAGPILKALEGGAPPAHPATAAMLAEIEALRADPA